MHAGVPWGCAVFAAGNRAFSVRDVIQAAQFRGELEAWTDRVRVLAECEQRGAKCNREADQAVLLSLSEQWRYERDLITAEETERWLEERGLTLEEFNDYFVRRYWKDALPGNVEPAASNVRSSAELQEMLRAELLLSGEFDRLAVQLAWRVAAVSATPDAAAAELVEKQRRRFVSAMEKLALLGLNERWFEEMLKLEAVFQRECDAVLTGESRVRMLGFLRMFLTRLDLEVIDFDSRDAAREAALCVREDGTSMAEVASDGRYPHRRFEILVEDLPPGVQQTYLCAAPGEVLGPFERGDGFQLSQLVRKIEPDLGDGEVRSRVERQLLERHFSELAGKHVRWIIPPNRTAA